MRWMNRVIRDDRGASAAFFAFLLIPLLAIGAIAVDIGALYADKANLQNSADAAALQVAIACAHDVTQSSCNSPNGSSIASANDPVHGATVQSLTVNTTTNLVVATVNTGGTGVSTPFDAVLPGGRSSAFVTATGAAEWGPITGASTLPLAIGPCDYRAPTTPATKVTIDINNTGSAKTCPGTSVPGGFGWLVLDSSGKCQATTSTGAWVGITTGNNPPGNPNGACSPQFFQDLIGTAVLIPVIGNVKGTGSTAQYQISGYAAFTITGYNFQGGYSNPDPTAPAPSGNTYIQGYFTNYVSVGGGSTIGPPSSCIAGKPCAMGAQLTLRTS